MIKISLTQETARPNGRFFTNVTEACNRGCTLTWASDYSKAILDLDTTIFLTKEDIKDIIKTGGEIEELSLILSLPKDVFETGYVSDDIVEYVYGKQYDEEGKEIELGKVHWKDLFGLTIETEDKDIVKFFDSPNVTNMPLPVSLVLKSFDDFEIIG